MQYLDPTQKAKYLVNLIKSVVDIGVYIDGASEYPAIAILPHPELEYLYPPDGWTKKGLEIVVQYQQRAFLTFNGNDKRREWIIRLTHWSGQGNNNLNDILDKILTVFATHTIDYEVSPNNYVPANKKLMIPASISVKCWDQAREIVEVDPLFSPIILSDMAIVGDPVVGEVLAIAPIEVAANPPATLTYQWLRDWVEVGDESTYLLTNDDLGTVVAVTVTATNSQGTDEVTSDEVAVEG